MLKLLLCDTDSYNFQHGYQKEMTLSWALWMKQYVTIVRATTEIEDVKASLLNGGVDLGPCYPKGLFIYR